MVKTYVDFELKQPLEKTTQEALDEVIERLLVKSLNGNSKDIKALAEAAKELALTKAILKKIEPISNS